MNRRIKNDVGSNTKVRDFRYGFATFLTEEDRIVSRRQSKWRKEGGGGGCDRRMVTQMMGRRIFIYILL